MVSRRRKVALSAVASVGVVAALGLSACSSSPSTSSTTPPANTSNSATPAAAAGTATDKATGSPIKVGYIDPVSGVEPLPSGAVGAKAALNYINNDLGGIGGHPIQLVTCDTDGTPTTNVNCANQFVQAQVSFVIDGFDLSSGSELPALNSAKIPLIGGWAANAAANASSTSFYFGPADQAFAVGPLSLAKSEGVKQVAYAEPEAPTYVAYIDGAVLPVAKKLGVNVSIVYYSATTGANWPVIVASLQAKNAQMVGLTSASEGECTSFLQALKAVSYSGKVLLATCSQFVQTVGASSAAGTLVQSGAWVPSMESSAPAAVKQQLSIYESQMAAAGGSAYLDDQHAAGVFGAFVTTANALNAAHSSYPLTGAAVSSVMRALKNFPAFLEPAATCNGQQWPGTSSCNHDILIAKVASTGDFQPVTNPPFDVLDPTLLP
jgi:branched-chain amino acid transport system substrate-binding protein